MRRKVKLTVYAFVVVLLTLWIADFAIGILLPMHWYTPGIIWPAGSRLTHTTREFSYSTTINALGYRDDLACEPLGKKRVIAIGDSFTYGYGTQRAWPDYLEDLLPDVCVDNLGQPGANPAVYALRAAVAVPLLRPDWVLVGLNEADDVFNMAMRAAPQPRPTLRNRAGAVVGRLLPHWLGAIRRLQQSPSVQDSDGLHAIMTGQTRDYLLDNPAERARFDALPQEVREAFEAGDVTTLLLHDSRRRPRFFTLGATPNAPETQEAIAVVARHLGTIREIAGEYGARVLAVAVPNGAYTDPRVQDTLRAVGFEMPPELLTTHGMDDVLAESCARAGIPLIKVTDFMREAARQQEFYYPLDGHLNENGQRLFAEALAGELVTQGYFAERNLP